jgi:hypothetical protein
MSKGEREMMKKMDDAMELQKEATDRVYQQRQEFIDMQKTVNTQISKREDWKELVYRHEQTLHVTQRKPRQQPTSNEYGYSVVAS